MFRLLAGAIPSSIGQMTALKEVNIGKNFLMSPMPTEISQLNLLQYLYVNDNRFDGQIPDEITQLTGLIELNLQNNCEFSTALFLIASFLRCMSQY
jgi:Leucine-rich repeat (LRR) protein